MQEINPKTRWFTQDGRLYEILHRPTRFEKGVLIEEILVQDYRGNSPYIRALPLKSYDSSIVEIESCEHEPRVYVPKRVVKEKRKKTKTHLG